MQQLRFKEGDQAKVLKYGSHVSSLGELVTIRTVYPDRDLEYLVVNSVGVSWYIADEELEPITVPETPPLGDIYVKSNLSMNVLYGEQKNTVETYSYTVNSGGHLDIKVSNGSSRTVTITFVNGKFEKAENNIGGSFIGTRSHWHVLEAISAKISELEAGYRAKLESENLPF